VLVRYGEKFFNFFKMRKKKLAHFVRKDSKNRNKKPPLLLAREGANYFGFPPPSARG